jgi:predicted AAA+ superfamily ATPase
MKINFCVSSKIIARDRELAKIREYLLDPQGRICILEGEIGTGKTTILTYLKKAFYGIYSNCGVLPKDTVLKCIKRFIFRKKKLFLIDEIQIANISLWLQLKNIVTLDPNTAVVVAGTPDMEVPMSVRFRSIRIHLKNFSKDTTRIFIQSLKNLPKMMAIYTNEIYEVTQGNPLLILKVCKEMYETNFAPGVISKCINLDPHEFEKEIDIY